MPPAVWSKTTRRLASRGRTARGGKALQICNVTPTQLYTPASFRPRRFRTMSTRVPTLHLWPRRETTWLLFGPAANRPEELVDVALSPKHGHNLDGVSARCSGGARASAEGTISGRSDRPSPIRRAARPDRIGTAGAAARWIRGDAAGEIARARRRARTPRCTARPSTGLPATSPISTRCCESRGGGAADLERYNINLVGGDPVLRGRARWIGFHAWRPFPGRPQSSRP